MAKKTTWKNWKLGDKIMFSVTEFDGTVRMLGVLTEMHEDHCIIKAEGMILWCDDDNYHMYRKVGA